MSNGYVYCPICGEKNEKWSGFWPDGVFNVRRSDLKCSECGFYGEILVKTGDTNVPKVDLESLRE